MKYVMEALKILKEAPNLSYYEQEQKMDAWHRGARKQNVGACSNEKLKMNYDICARKGYVQEANQLFAEAKRRGLSWAQPQPQPQPQPAPQPKPEPKPVPQMTVADFLAPGNYDHAMPREADFSQIAVAKSRGHEPKDLMNYITAKLDPSAKTSGEYVYRPLRCLVVAALFGWQDLVVTIKESLKNVGVNGDDVKKVFSYVINNKSQFEDAYKKYVLKKIESLLEEVDLGDLTQYIPQDNDFRKVCESIAEWNENGDNCNFKLNPNRLPGLLRSVSKNNPAPLIRRFVASSLLGWELLSNNLKEEIKKMKVTQEDIGTILKEVIAKKEDFIQDYMTYKPIFERNNVKKTESLNEGADTDIEKILNQAINNWNLKEALLEDDQVNAPITFSWGDFQPADASFVADHLDDPKTLIDNCRTGNNAIHQAILTYIYGTFLKMPEITKNSLIKFLTVNCGVTPTELKDTILGILGNPELKARLAGVLEFIKEQKQAEMPVGTNQGVTTRIKDPSKNFCRLIVYDTSYNPACRRHILFGKKEAGIYHISIGSSQFGPGRNWFDEPFFENEMQARNFIANADKIKTKVDVRNFKYVISDEPAAVVYDKDDDRNIRNLDNCYRVSTDCGPAFIEKRCKNFRESLTEDAEVNEDIERHDTLNPKLWNEDETLKPEVEEKIKEIVATFVGWLAEDEIKLIVKDIVLIGSNCSYNYTKDSDLDIHIIADTSNLVCPDNLYPKLYSAYRSMFNKKFDIDFYGIPVEVYVETEGLNTISNGVYSVLNNKWLKHPELQAIPEIDREAFDKEFVKWEDRYNQLLADPAITADKISQFIDDIYEVRKTGLPVYGEYGIPNLTFKELRNKGYLDHLKDLKDQVYSRELSLESLTEERRRLTYEQIRDYAQKIGQIAHSQAIVHENGMFEIYNIKEDEVDFIVYDIQRQGLAKYVRKVAGRFDFSRVPIGNLPRRYYDIRGEVK